jgi:hypothetical protein
VISIKENICVSNSFFAGPRQGVIFLSASDEACICSALSSSSPTHTIIICKLYIHCHPTWILLLLLRVRKKETQQTECMFCYSPWPSARARLMDMRACVHEPSQLVWYASARAIIIAPHIEMCMVIVTYLRV